jgi:protease-4
MRLISKLFYPITAPIRFIQNNFKSVLFLTILYFVISSSDATKIAQPNLQIIELNSVIIDASDILEKIEKAKNNPHIKGVLLKVNSPGGAVAPSVEISYAIKELSSIKPTVAYASGVMASGSYYSSIWANKIVANPGSMIGSIGVIMQSANLSKLMEKIGIETQNIKVGKYKEIGTPTRKWTTDEKNELQKVAQDTYDMFVEDVAKARKLNKKDYKKYADAHIFTAKEAKEVGLIDEVATISYAKKLVQKLSGTTKPIWSKENKFDKMMHRFLTNTISNIVLTLNGLKAY